MSSFVSLPQIAASSIAQSGATNGQVLEWNGSYWAPATGGGGGGGLTSVGLSMPADFTVANSPLTANGTLGVTWNNEAQNSVHAGPASGGSGAPVWRALVAGDIPSLPSSQITGLAPSATTDTTNASNITSGALSLSRLAQGGATSGQVITWNGSAWAPANTGSGSGTVTSVALATVSDPLYTVSGSPVTTSGTLTLTANTQTANTFLAGPTSGSAAAPAFRALVAADTPVDPQVFGDGSDGSTTVTTTLSLSRDMYYTNFTVSSGARIYTNGNRIFVNGILDISNPGTGYINSTLNGLAGGNGTSGGTAGGAGNNSGAGSLGASINGAAGGAGGTTTGTQAAANTANANSVTQQTGGSGGAGGLGSSGAGGAQRVVSATTYYPFRRVDYNVLRGATLMTMGGSGTGGSGGGGDGTTGGGGGGGAGGGGSIVIFANTINRGASTVASCIVATGGVGGYGGSAAAGNRGGGGGGGGGNGGWVYIAYANLTGTTTTTGPINVSGGAGGNGGSGFGTGVGGNGGGGGGSGEVILVNLTTGTFTVTTGSAGSAGGSASGTTAGTGGNPATLTVNF